MHVKTLTTSGKGVFSKEVSVFVYASESSHYQGDTPAAKNLATIRVHCISNTQLSST